MAYMLSWLGGAPITPSDSSNTPYIFNGIYVGTGGSLKFQFNGGAVVTLENVPSGETLPMKLDKVFATGTTASDLVGLI